MSLRDAFPVCSRVAYLNAGTDGPVPAAALAAATAALEDQAERGRTWPHFEARFAGQAALREACARLIGAAPEEVALTTSTSEGLAKVIAGLGAGPGHEILTADDEHPGLLGPLIAARERGAVIRTGPLERLADHITPATTLIACSHVSWMTGAYADPRLYDSGLPVVLDGAQSAGAVPVDVRALGCAAFAAAGQKWLCGADGTGFLYLEPAFGTRVQPVGPGYMAFERTDGGLDSPLHAGARRHDTPALAREAVALSLAAVETLERYGWDRVHRHGIELAQELADRLAARGIAVVPRSPTTLVAFEHAQPEQARDALAADGVLLRDLPGGRHLRASVGVWNDEHDLERLLAGL